MVKSKGISPADTYVCTLPKELYKLAEDELRETKATRDHAIQAMRDWIATNPRIAATRLDCTFLLRFLRAKKFSLPMAQESFERYLLLRNSYDGIFLELNYQLDPLKELFQKGYMFALPKRDKHGRRIVFTRPAVFDPYRHHNYEMLKIHGMTYEMLMENEENQIRGLVHIVDGAGIGMPYMTIFTPKEAARIVKNGEKTLPMRHKEVIGLNVHGSVKFAVDFALSIVSEKMRKRIKFFTVAELGKHIDASLLPKEYGGVQPMAEMIDLWSAELKAGQKQSLANDAMRVHMEMYSAKAREGAVSALSEPMHCNSKEESTLQGLQGSFRKLEVD